jgi:hypothetical protein
MKPTFSNTIDILVKAYLNDTLQHESCSACAVGNLVSHSMANHGPMGLMAVVEILADIHGVSLEQKQEAISLFKKPSHLELNYQQDEEMIGI